MHVKAIGTKKSEILAKITFLGIFGQILPKAPIVQGPNKVYSLYALSSFAAPEGLASTHEAGIF